MHALHKCKHLLRWTCTLERRLSGRSACIQVDLASLQAECDLIRIRCKFCKKAVYVCPLARKACTATVYIAISLLAFWTLLRAAEHLSTLQMSLLPLIARSALIFRQINSRHHQREVLPASLSLRDDPCSTPSLSLQACLLPEMQHL